MYMYTTVMTCIIIVELSHDVCDSCLTDICWARRLGVLCEVWKECWRESVEYGLKQYVNEVNTIMISYITAVFTIHTDVVKESKAQDTPIVDPEAESAEDEVCSLPETPEYTEDAFDKLMILSSLTLFQLKLFSGEPLLVATHT